MILLSELISKRVISMVGAKDEGTVANALFNSKFSAISVLKLFSDIDNDASIRYLDYKKIKSIGMDAVIINDELSITFEWNTKLEGLVTNPMNLECFNQDGKALGFVTDVELDDGKVVSIIISDKRYLPSKLVSISKTLIIINDTDKPIKLIKPSTRTQKPPKPSNANDAIVTLHTNELNIEKNPKTDTKIPQSTASTQQEISIENKAVATPPRVPPSGTTNPNQTEHNASSPYKFLLGKTLMRDIKLDNGDLLFLAKTIVTDKIISLARDNGKLVQLALHAE